MSFGYSLHSAPDFIDFDILYLIYLFVSRLLFIRYLLDVDDEISDVKPLLGLFDDIL